MCFYLAALFRRNKFPLSNETPLKKEDKNTAFYAVRIL